MIGQGFGIYHGLRTLREEIAFNAWPKIQYQSQFQVRPKHILSATWAQFFRYLGLGVCSPRNLYLTFMPAKRLAQKCLIFSLGICVSHIFNNEHFLLEVAVLNANRRVSFRHLRSYLYIGSTWQKDLALVIVICYVNTPTLMLLLSLNCAYKLNEQNHLILSHVDG